MDERIGQLVWAFISSADDLESVERAIHKGHVGGVWLLPTELRSPAESVELINRLQAAAPKPLLVGVDAEAGLGLVMEGATQLPTAMAIGATCDPHLAREAARVTALESSACGINAVAAPVLDVNVNPANPIINTRAFGEDPALVSRLGLAFMDGLQSSQRDGSPVLPIGKHFPGHGDTVQDSHLHLDTVGQSRARLEAVELPPFREAITAGIPMLMTAHVAYPALDPVPDRPATLSAPILADLLRGELHFNGAVVTDCMNMYAIAHGFDARESTVRAVQAGCDLILTDQWDLAYEAISDTARDGEISEARLGEAADRVRVVKQRVFGSAITHPAPADPQRAKSTVGSPANTEVADRIAAASVTLVDGNLPPDGRRPLIMATRMARRFAPPVESQVRTALRTVGWDDAEVLMLDPAPDPAQIQEAVQHARACGWATLLFFNRVQSFDPDAVLVSDELLRLAHCVADTGIPLSVVSLGSPYALPLFERTVAQLCSYSTCDASLQATLRVLMGTAEAPGQLPIRLR